MGTSSITFNIAAYDSFRSAILSRWRRGGLKDEELCRQCQSLAQFAHRFHSAVFCDAEIENLLLAVGKRIDCEQNRLKDSTLGAIDVCNSERGKPRVLHVVTLIATAGGHSRYLANWIKSDASSSHTVILTNQRNALPEFFGSMIHDGLCDVIMFPIEEDIIQKSLRLRSLAGQFDRVVLHQHPEDPIPVIAFATKDLPPVLMFNHAHFWFSFGTSVSDLVVNTLPYYRDITCKYRQPQLVDLITGCYEATHLPLIDTKMSVEKRQVLGIDPSKRVIVSIGNSEYYRPKTGQDFFRTLTKILSRCDQLEAVIIGPTGKERFLSQYADNPRIHFKGVVAEPLEYYQCGDVVLESFPHPSLGGFLEGFGFSGMMPVPAYGGGNNIYRVDLPVISDLVVRQPDEASYVDYVVSLLRDDHHLDAERVGRQLKYREWTVRHSWKNEFARIYAILDSIDHRFVDLVPVEKHQLSEDNFLLASNNVEDILGYFYNRLSLLDATKMSFSVLTKLHPIHGIGYGSRWVVFVFKKIRKRILDLFIRKFALFSVVL